MLKPNYHTLITTLADKRGTLTYTVRLFCSNVEADQGIAHTEAAALALGEAMLKGALRQDSRNGTNP